MTHSKSQTPLVSMITTVKNCKDYVARCINSFSEQTYQNVEIVVQDGASTDGTLDILNNFGKHINLESKPDKSGIAAITRAVHRAQGDIVCWCGADDEILPTSVEKSVQAFIDNPQRGVIYGDAYRADLQGNIFDVVKYSDWDYKHYLCDEIHILFGCAFFKKSCLWEGLSFINDNPGGEFQIFAPIGLKYPFYHLPEIVSKCAFHENALSCDIGPIMKDGDLKKETVIKICDDINTPDEIRNLKQKALLNIELHLMKQCFQLGFHEQAKQYRDEALRVYPELLLRRKSFLENVEDKIRNKKIFIYGGGEHTKFLLDEIDTTKTEILGIIDSEQIKWGNLLYGHKIFSPEILQNSKAEVLLSSFAGQESMHEVVRRHGCPSIQLYNKTNYQDTLDFVNIYHVTKL